MLTDGDKGGCSNNVALVFSEKDLHAVFFLSIEDIPHMLEIFQRATGKSVTLSSLQVDLVETRQVVTGAKFHFDAKFGSFFDIASPQLIHALEELILGFLSAVFVAQRKLKVELRLTSSKPLISFVSDPSALLKHRYDVLSFGSYDVRLNLG